MNYAVLIPETVEQLTQLEARQRLAIHRDRVRFIRLLKTGLATSQQQAGQAINLAIRQSQRLWQTYRKSGLAALLQATPKAGFGKLSAAQIAQLQAWLRTDRAGRLEDVQTYIAQRWQIHYTIGGLSYLCQRLKIKLKTGRPVNLRQDPAAREAFKKNLRT